MTPFVWLSTKSHPKSTQNRAISAFHPDKGETHFYHPHTPQKDKVNEKV